MNSKTDIPECTDLHVTCWFSDETLFSLCSRQHKVSNNEFPKDTCKLLFGDMRQGTSHDVPTRLGAFTALTQNRFGDPKSVLLEHTLLPFYLGLQTKEFSNRLIQSAIDGDSSTIKADLGLLAGRLGATHPLKACPKCMEHDLRSVHVGYWHVGHQLPGVWICREHKEPLLYSNLKVTGLKRFGWCLPNSAELLRGPAEKLSMTAQQTLFDIAVICDELRDLGANGGYIEIKTLSEIYKNALSDQAIYFAQAKSSKSFLGNQFLQRFGELRTIPDFAWINADPVKAAEQLLSLVVRESRSSHPLKHALLINFLFTDWRAFIDEHDSLPFRRMHEKPNQASIKSSISKEVDPRLEKLLALLNKGHSKTAAAKELGITVHTVMVWSAKLGIKNDRRPKLLDEPIRSRLITALRKGVDKQVAAERFTVSIQTITTTLRTEVGLHQAWQQARFLNSQKSARSIWQKAASTLKQASAKSLRNLEPSAFAWLYRNDRDWLNAFASERLTPEVRINRSPIDWAKRDVETCAQLKIVTSQWRDENHHQKLTITKLCELVPGLKSKLSSLNKLPSTRDFLSFVSGRQSRKMS